MSATLIHAQNLVRVPTLCQPKPRPVQPSTPNTNRKTASGALSFTSQWRWGPMKRFDKTEHYALPPRRAGSSFTLLLSKQGSLKGSKRLGSTVCPESGFGHYSLARKTAPCQGSYRRKDLTPPFCLECQLPLRCALLVGNTKNIEELSTDLRQTIDKGCNDSSTATLAFF